MKKVLLILGHSSKQSLANAFLNIYKSELNHKKIEFETILLPDLKFDPILHEGYNQIQALEPDLVEAQNKIKWADHIVLFTPIWWYSLPALLKGFFDRILLPGFGFKYIDGKLNPLLKNKSAQVVLTTGGPAFYYKYLRGRGIITIITKGIFNYCGIKPVKITIFGSMSKPKQVNLDKAFQKIKKIVIDR